MTADRRPFRALAVAETCSIAGTRLSTIAIPWLVLTTTHSAVLTGLVAFAEMAPYVVAKALGGPLIDLIGAKRIAVVADSLSVAVVALIPVLHLLDLLPIWALVPIVFLMGTLRGPADGATYSLVPQVAELGEMPLERVTGVASVVERLASTVGAGLAGGLVALLGPTTALAFNAVTFAVAAVLIQWGIPAVPRREPSAPEPSDREVPRAETGMATYVRDLREGWDFLRKDAVLVGLVVMVAVTNLLDQAWSVVLLPSWIQESGNGAGLLGLVFAVFSGFSILGSAVAAAVGERLPRLLIYTVAFLLTGFPRFMIFVLDVPLVALFATLAIGGLASGFINPILSAVIFERIPAPLLGRVSSLNTALCWALIPFGGLLGGALIALMGVHAALLVIGLAYLLATLLPLARKSFRGFSSRPQPTEVADDKFPATV